MITIVLSHYTETYYIYPKVRKFTLEIILFSGTH